MIQRILAVVVFGLAAAAGSAQEAPIAITLRLQPRAAPVPALKYRLIPEIRDQIAGNAVQSYLRAMNPEWYNSVGGSQKLIEQAGDLTRTSPGSLTPEQVKKFQFLRRSKMLMEIDRGARRSYCDWELVERARVDGVGTLLPDVQSMRSLIHLMQMRAKLELRDRNFGAAATSLQTEFGLSRHVGSGPFLIQGLVGVACASIAQQAVEDWITMPDSPNLYWALTDLPSPLIDLRNGFEGERLLVDAVFPHYREMLDDPSIPPPSAAELDKMLKNYLDLASGPTRPPLERAFGRVTLSLRCYPEAKRFLRETGRTDEQIEAMPVLHAVFLYQTHRYDVAYDSVRRWVRLPYAEMNRYAKKDLDNSPRKQGNYPEDMDILLVPAIFRVCEAGQRVDRRIAALRCVEAIRMYAAKNGGKLPATLADITEVPVPIDTWTGKPFEYRLEGDKASLIGPNPTNEALSTRNSIHYILVINSVKEKK
jgi:hypothetical protein